MTLNLHSCTRAGTLATDSEILELARRLERGDNNCYAPANRTPVNIGFGTREAAIVVEALRRG